MDLFAERARTSRSASRTVSISLRARSLETTRDAAVQKTGPTDKSGKSKDLRISGSEDLESCEPAEGAVCRSSNSVESPDAHQERRRPFSSGFEAVSPSLLHRRRVGRGRRAGLDRRGQSG